MSKITILRPVKTTELADSGVRILCKFPVDGTDVGCYIDFTVKAHCRDANFFWVPWKDCRPKVDLIINSREGYEYNALLGLWYVVDAKITEFELLSDKHCKIVNLEVVVYSQSPLPSNGKILAGGPIITLNGSFGTPVLSEIVNKIKFCCKDCKLDITFDSRDEPGKMLPPDPQKG